MTYFLSRYAPLLMVVMVGWVAIEKFTNIKRHWFEQYLSLEYGIPSHDTFGHVFSFIERLASHKTVEKSHGRIRRARSYFMQ